MKEFLLQAIKTRYADDGHPSVHAFRSDIETLIAEVEALQRELRDTIHDEYCGGNPPGTVGCCKPRCVELTKEIAKCRK